MIPSSTSRLDRSHFVMWVVGGSLAVTLIAFLIVAASSLLSGQFPGHWLIVLVILGWMLIYLGRIVPARMRDIGWNPLLTLLFFLSLINLGVLIMLLVIPTKKTAFLTPFTAGTPV